MKLSDKGSFSGKEIFRGGGALACFRVFCTESAEAGCDASGSFPCPDQIPIFQKTPSFFPRSPKRFNIKELLAEGGHG